MSTWLPQATALAQHSAEGIHTNPNSVSTSTPTPTLIQKVAHIEFEVKLQRLDCPNIPQNVFETILTLFRKQPIPQVFQPTRPPQIITELFFDQRPGLRGLFFPKAPPVFQHTQKVGRIDLHCPQRPGWRLVVSAKQENPLPPNSNVPSTGQATFVRCVLRHSFVTADGWTRYDLSEVRSGSGQVAHVSKLPPTYEIEVEATPLAKQQLPPQALARYTVERAVDLLGRYHPEVNHQLQPHPKPQALHLMPLN